ncbi:methyl-accepting chemotaxis protein [Alkalitalea saponilacus]|uniref:Methyl-accepting chemotaxis sensory transducer with Cache sensor n=1 Tax=Alkalitalea saponilacus TaxID=889453 RepID=A0A1T5ALY5_9BACT|nr:methyl-accepting chemotaxis protein [Alkalitalea saponilacus]ASB48661.1 hypothetical protein CDL62_05650 [Alkalitalea saponilacus]SKB35817.1 methyl-accepting chemotaxis sensory transducer with Cache sensor [Alkalitalea saponilacus]
MIKVFFSKLKNKIAFFTGVAMFVLAALITTTFSYITYRNGVRQIEDLEVRLMDNLDLLLISEVETAVSMLKGFNDKIVSGELGYEEGTRLAADVLRELRFGEEGYFWADTKDGTNVVLPGSTGVEGFNRIDLVDSHGNEFIRDILNAGISGGGFAEYWFPKLGETEALPKRGYSLLFEPFGWVIGTGLYYDDIEEAVQTIRVQRQEDLTRTIVWVVLIALIFVLLGLGFAYYAGLKISNPISDLSNKTREVAGGNLSVEVESRLNDEVGDLSRSLANMIKKLQQIVMEISEGASNVVVASQQMSSASQIIADGASEQAASTEEIGTSMEEMVSSIMQNTDNANKADSVVNESEQSMAQLTDAFKETLEAMEQITSRITIIKEISTQTNLLALNAAVEAARAGDAGRGFSVVAGEVKKLSENTQRAANDISQLSKNSLAVAKHAWELLEKLIPEFQQTAILVKEISASSGEQRTGADMINAAVQSMVNVTNQNSASSEELASSSEELASQAESLKDAVNFFKFKSS